MIVLVRHSYHRVVWGRLQVTDSGHKRTLHRQRSAPGQTRPICDVRVTSAIPSIAAIMFRGTTDAKRHAGQASHRVRR